MLTSIRKYVKAFVVALRLTLRGEKPPLLRVRDEYPDLAAWWSETVVLVKAIERAADANGLDAAARAKFTVHVDSRDVSMATILSTIRYHAEHEYPFLMAHNDEFNPVTLQAININDRFLILRLNETVAETLKPSVKALSDHLEKLFKV